MLPDIVGSSFLPLRDLPLLPAIPSEIENQTMMRLVFDASKISDLKMKFTRETSGEVTNQCSNLSGVEVILALIIKAAISATRSVTKLVTKSVI